VNIFFNWKGCIYAMTGTLLKMSKVWVKHGGMVKICYYILLDIFELFQGGGKWYSSSRKQNLFHVQILL